MKELLLIATVRGIGHKWQIVTVDEETAQHLMSQRQAYNTAAPSIRRRFATLIRQRAEEDARLPARS